MTLQNNLNVRLTDEQKEALDREAEKLRLSPSDLIRHLINQFVK